MSLISLVSAYLHRLHSCWSSHSNDYIWRHYFDHYHHNLHSFSELPYCSYYYCLVYMYKNVACCCIWKSQVAKAIISLDYRQIDRQHISFLNFSTSLHSIVMASLLYSTILQRPWRWTLEGCHKLLQDTRSLWPVPTFTLFSVKQTVEMTSFATIKVWYKIKSDTAITTIINYTNHVV